MTISIQSKNLRYGQAGFSLPELMIASALGLGIIAGTILIFTVAVGSSSDTLKSARLNNDLDAAMSLMTNDLRRAGFRGGTIDKSYSISNPFMDANPSDGLTTNLNVLENGNCILYSYDCCSTIAPQDEPDGAVDSNEFYGFRLNNGNVQMRLTGNTTDDCTDGTWQALNISSGSEMIEVTNLVFSLNPLIVSGTTIAPGQTKCIDKDSNVAHTSTCAAASLTSGTSAAEARQVNILIEGRVANDSSITKSLSNTVKIRNDRIFTVP